MLKQGLSRKLTDSLLVIMLVAFGAGCSGGGNGTDPDINVPPQVPPPTTGNDVNAVAKAGPIVALRVGETAVLDGSGSSTSSSQPLSFLWSFSHKPAASQTELQNATSATPSFVIDARGAYVAQLVVSAAGVTSRRDIQVVVGTVPPEPQFFHDGLSSHCVNCHSDDFNAIPSKALNHIGTSNTCATCHTPSPSGFSVIHFVDHLEVFGNCSECHNGVLAIGKSDFHVPTVVECHNCHNTNHFLDLEPDGSFDHTGISSSCTGCHNGRLATGKTPSPPHPDTNIECGFCHTTASFLGAFPDHSGPEVVGKRCDSCHGISATGPIDGHPVMPVDCGSCHGIGTFSLGGVYNHRLIDAAIQTCESCHNDNNSINAPGKSSAVPTHVATTSDCAMCHNTDSFTPAFTDHTGIVDNCVECHGVSASGKSANHMPTTEDCSVCHVPGTFGTGIYDHAGVVDNCASCHDNVISVGKLANHLPTTADCSVCHNTADFADATFDHVGIDFNNCTSCHDGNISVGKSVNHVPTTLDCSSCHDINNFASFAGISYSHLDIDPNNCAVCHATGIATPKKSNHIPTLDDCSVCHDSTVAFTSTTFLAGLHQEIGSGCEGCHVSVFFPADLGLVKAANHLPTEQNCHLCHTTDSFAPSVFDHVGISGNCASCHDGSHVGLGALQAPNTAVHQNTSGDCAVCHNTTDFADAFVDHSGPDVVGKRCDLCHNGVDATGKDAKPDHVVTQEDCGVCHVAGGAFAPATFDHTGIVDNCASCHDGATATGMSPTHVPISPTQDCSLCHNTTAFAGAAFDHEGIVGNCASCHDGNTATGKHGNHVPTNSDCSVCHQTTGFLPAAFDHVGIVDNCQSCHDGALAEGKSANHVDTNQDCGVCHNTNHFSPATFDHTGIVDNCASCHGVTATGKSPDHVPTVLDCSFCHTTATFAGGIFDHQGINGDCASCHDGTTATGSMPQGPNDHFITVAECNDCHTTNGWAPIDYSHSNGGDYPGDHRDDPGCMACHDDNDENISYPSAQYAPFCAACHAGDFESEGDHIGGKSGTVEQNKDCSGGGSGCHKVSDSKFD